MGYATAIIVLSALPVFFIEGVSGAFVEPAVRAYLLAIAASLVVALTLTPALCFTLRPRGASPLMDWTRRRYDAALARVLRRPRVALAVAGAVALLGLAIIPALHGPVVPSFKDPNLLVHLDGPPGTSNPEMSRIVARASRDLRSIPGVRDVAGHVGRAVTGDQVVDVNSSELWVKLDPAADYDATKAAVERTVDSYAGLGHSVLTYERQRVRDIGSIDDREAGDGSPTSADLAVLTGTNRRPLVVRVFGEDLGELRRQGERMKRLLAGVDGVVDPRVERLVQEPTVAIEVSLPRAQRYGIKPGDVRREATTLLQGIQVGSLFEKQKVFEVVVRATPDARASLTDVRNLLLDTPGGGHARLGEIADVRVRPTPQVIERDSSSRRIDVSADVTGRSLGAVQDDVRQRLRRASFPLEYHAQVIGDATGARASATHLAGFAIAAAIGIFLLLQAAFRSWRRACLAFLALPVGLVGGELAGLAGGAFSLGALFGLLAVLALAARHAVALFARYRRLEAHDGERFGPALVLHGAGDRLAPILTTALATAVALLPFVVLGDRPGYELVQPMAVVILGGLVTSTLMVLFVLPVLYLSFGETRRPAVDYEAAIVRQWAGAEAEPAATQGNGPQAAGHEAEREGEPDAR
jgi:Cu/Ag efflux pump CusA